MDIEIFEVAGGFGFTVGNVFQEFDPDLEDCVPMKRPRAEALAAEVAARLSQNDPSN